MTVIKHSLWIYVFSASSCGACESSVRCIKQNLPLETKGIRFVDNIKEADCILVMGIINFKNLEVLRRKYIQAPRPCFVIAAGVCAISEGIFAGSYNSAGRLDKKLRADYFIPGCPPPPLELLEGLKKFQYRFGSAPKKIKVKKKKWK